ncbi:efflux RND transporter permease subunit [Microbacterium sp. HMWF026]|uniref:efflux RND transporter permease subunit n=1 Tax=Microbacterium sp. HMWF026 TaxID=2056861 RepID=UPI0015E8175B|nr:efflux RND transporter permease subunit [Microbacterium sp. HMWF026]
MSSLTRLSLANRLVVILLSLFVVVAGVVAAAGLRQELLPSLQPPSVSVVATYAGASATAVEREVTVPVEEAVRAVRGVQTVTSTSSAGVSRVTAGWTDGRDAQQVIADVRSATAGIRSSLPAGVTLETYTDSTDDLPAVQLAVTSAGDLSDLSAQLQRSLVPALRAVDGVRDVTVAGVDEKQLVVTVRPADATAKEVTAAQVDEVLTASVVVTPAGTSLDGATVRAVEVGGIPVSVEEVAALVIPTAKGPVSIGDVADVAIESAPQTSLARLGHEPALTLSITKTPEASVGAVSHAVSRVLESQRDALSPGVEFTTIFDQAPYIEQSLHDLTTEGVLGLVFAIAVILVFLLSVRATIITAISIPLSVLIAMIGLAVGGFSLSILTLAALTIAVGRVVDDSIVVIENIARHERIEKLTTPRLVRAVREVAGAITASTLTTVAVFLPIAFVPGTTGELLRPFAVTVTVALLGSLLVSLTVVPVLASSLLRRRSARPPAPEGARTRHARQAAMSAREEERRARWAAHHEQRRARRGDPPPAPVPSPGSRAESEPFDRLQSLYLPVLHLSLRRPIATLIVGAFVFALTIGASGALRQNFLDDGGGRPTVSVIQTLPPGTSLVSASDRAARLEAILNRDDDVVNTLTTVSGDSAAHTVLLQPDADVEATVTRLRAEFADLADVGQVIVQNASSAGGSDLTVTVSGGDDQARAAGAARVQAALDDLPDLDDVRSDAAADLPLLSVAVDHQRAAQYGFTQADVGRAIQDALRGTVTGTVDIDGRTLDVVLRGQGSDSSPDQIGALELPVSAIQQAAAQKRAADALAADQSALQVDAEAQQDRDLAEQLTDARGARAQAQGQLSDLVAQLGALNAAPVPAPSSSTSPVDSGLDPSEAAARDAAEARAEVDALSAALAEEQRRQQIGQLQDAIAQTKSTIEQLGKQVDTLIETREEQTSQRAKAAALADRQKGLSEVTATPIQVRDIATVQSATGVSTITRTDGVRAITLTATPTGDDPSAILQNVGAALGSLDLPGGVTARLGGAATEQDDALTQLGLAMLAAIGIVFLIMAATLRSLVQPLVLLVSIPFAATGAIALMLATGTPLGVPAMIGLLMLIGIVVTNAIVLVDLINARRAAGHDLASAVIDGARLRVRPILMTAAATILALVPMALGLTGGGVFISHALAIVVIGGLVTSTLLTLVFVPVLYLLIERSAQRRRERRRPA